MREITAEKHIALKPAKHTWSIRQNRLPVLLIAGILLVNLKKMFADFHIDVEYAVAMSYRLAMGDHMFSQMREPHQTSAFLLAFFIKIWMWATGSTTGIVLYLNAVSLVFKLLVVLFFYHTLKKYCAPMTAFLAASFLAISNAKTYVILDFSNMQTYSAILLFCCLTRYFENQRRKKWLILSALCLCLLVLSYPSCLLIYFIVIGLLLGMSDTRLNDCLLLSAICSIMGISYIVFFGFRLGWAEFLFYIREILAGDSSHAVTMAAKMRGYKNVAGYIKELENLLLLYGSCALLSCISTLSVWLVRRNAMRPKGRLVLSWCVSFFILLGVYDLFCIITVYDDFLWVEGYIPLTLLGIFLLRYCSEPEKKLFWLGTCLSLGCMSAVLLLTNLSFATAMTYMLLGVAVAFLPIVRGLQTIKQNSCIPLYIFLALILFRNFYTFVPMSIYFKTIFSVENIVKSGPAIGIVSDYMGPHIMNSDMQEWSQHVKPGDRLLLVSESGVVSTLPYLYEDVEICAASTICTPTYDEKLLQYWEQNPGKRPNVVAVDCWFGHLNVEEDSWIMQWIYEEFGADSYEDGNYLRYYRRPDTE